MKYDNMIQVYFEGKRNGNNTQFEADCRLFAESGYMAYAYDSRQIFLLGGSQGGLVTTLVAEEIADEVKGMILYFPALCIADDWRRNYPKNVLIIWGNQDAIVSYDYVNRAEKIYPHANLIVVPNVGHDSSSATFRENALSFMRKQ